MIRNAKKEDFEAVRDMLVNGGLTTPDFFTKERYEKGVEQWGKYCLVCEKDGKAIGFVSGFDDGGIFYGYMGRLVVDEKYRRHGIGEQLTKACLQEFRKAGVPVVFAGVGLNNGASQKLLRKAGFVDEGYRLLYLDTAV